MYGKFFQYQIFASTAIRLCFEHLFQKNMFIVQKMMFLSTNKSLLFYSIEIFICYSFSNEAYSTAKFIKKVFNGSRRGSMTPAENSRAETTKTSAISPFTDNFDKISAHQSSLESEENFQESDASISNNTLSSSSIGSRIIEK